MSAGDTPGSSFTTRDTVLKLTPARAATSRSVGRLPSPIVVLAARGRWPVLRPESLSSVVIVAEP